MQAFFDEGVLTRNGGVRMTRPLGQVRIPSTVQGILARAYRPPAGRAEGPAADTRGDRPGHSACLVRQCPRYTGRIERILADLQAGEFIYEQPCFRRGCDVFFKHALTQEVAYNSLLMERRKLLHERVGNALESLFADADDHLASWRITTATALTSARRSTIWGVRAAGDAALRATWKPKALLRRGLELLKELPDDMERAREEFDLQRRSGFFRYSHTIGPGAPEREAVPMFEQRSYVNGSGMEPRLIKALMHLANLRMNRLELHMARELAGRAVALTVRVDDPGFSRRSPLSN